MNAVVSQNNKRLNVHPGEWYFGREYQEIYTVLGPCVALTAWHPRLKIGGVCHFVLPGAPVTPRRRAREHQDNSSRYAKFALLNMKQAMQGYAPLVQFQLGIYGGSDNLMNYGIGKQNILYVQQWLVDEQQSAHQVDVGGINSRSIILNVLTGIVKLTKS